MFKDWLHDRLFGEYVSPFEAQVIAMCKEGYVSNQDVDSICVYVSDFGTHAIIPVTEDIAAKLLDVK